MKLLLYLILLLLTLFNVYQGSFFVRNGEVGFHADIARDFLLLQELDEKKIVFIGPRSNTNGLFHGPLWTYINYPAFIIGKGDPVVVAWFWIFLEVIFLLTSFFIAKKLFGTFAALAYIVFLSSRLVPHINRVFHSEATIFFVPLLFFTIYKYIESKKNIYLALHLGALAILAQLNIGVGISLFMLSGLLILWFIVKHRLWKHVFTLLLTPLFLSNFIIFDLRHSLQMTQAIFNSAQDTRLFSSLSSLIENRIQIAVSLQLIQDAGPSFIIIFLFIAVIVFTVIQIKSARKDRSIYLLFVFYYFGYILLSFMTRGVLLYHYIHLLIPLTTLWFVSFLGSKYRLVLIPFIVFVFHLNFTFATSYVASAESFIGTDYNSWKSLSTVAKEVIDMQKNKEFGYFVFAPDALAYQPRYAMIYNFKKANVKAFEYTKKPITYVIAAPPPGNNPYMTHVWWRKVQVRISSEPIETKKFPNGFTIEKFNLSPEEQRVPHVKAIELGIHFR